MTAPPMAPGRVLPTLNEDGSRRWVRPKWSDGRYATWRRWVAYVLMVVFFAIPHLRMAGKPLVLLDLPRREFTLFGTTFLPTDTLLLMLLFISSLIGIFLLTALFGRAWCGWACPQTVYMEFVFRPLERLFEGGYAGSRRMDAEGDRWHPRRIAKNVVFLGIALFLSHTFLAYFVGVETLAQWVRRSPVEHPTSFAVMAIVTTAVFIDFAFLREQICLVACPYGRWQSALLDRQSLIVAYDVRRGEPRGKGKGRDGLGDCVDCGACVATCPTGIDIRDGLQMECIHCTQCADACDAVMRKLGKPEGLVRYTTRDLLDGAPRTLLRPRTVLYPLAFAGFFGMFLWQLGTKDTADVTLLGSTGTPFTLEPDGSVANQLRIKVANRSPRAQRYAVSIADAPEARLIAPLSPLPVAPGESSQMPAFVVLPQAAFLGTGVREVHVRVTDGDHFDRTFQYRLVGPRSPRAVPGAAAGATP